MSMRAWGDMMPASTTRGLARIVLGFLRGVRDAKHANPWESEARGRGDDEDWLYGHKLEERNWYQSDLRSMGEIELSPKLL